MSSLIKKNMAVLIFPSHSEGQERWRWIYSTTKHFRNLLQ